MAEAKEDGEVRTPVRFACGALACPYIIIFRVVDGPQCYKAIKRIPERKGSAIFSENLVKIMSMTNSPRIDSMDYRLELLSPDANAETCVLPSWKLNFDDMQFPENNMDQSCGFLRFIPDRRKRVQVKKYYKKQESLLKGFNEMDLVTGLRSDDAAQKEEDMRQLARSERMAIRISNAANLVLFLAKVYASFESRSLAVIASTLDSFLDLLSGFVLWFTANAMRKPNQYHYPIGKNRMQPVGIIVFASVMATLGLQVLFVSGQELIVKEHHKFDLVKERWMIGIMVFVTVVKLILFVYCRRFKNEIVRAYAQDHFFDVITNSTGLIAAVLAARLKWWIDPVGAIIIALYTISTWARTVLENVLSLIGKTASPEYLSTLTYLVWNHHEEVKHIDTVRAYTFGSHYFVEVDIVLPGDMQVVQAHNIGETLQEKLEQLPEVERAFVHIDFEATHKPEHKTKV